MNKIFRARANVKILGSDLGARRTVRKKKKKTTQAAKPGSA